MLDVRRLLLLIPEVPPYVLNENLPQILAAAYDLDGRDFCRLDRSNVGAAHVAIYRSISALAGPAHFMGSNQYDSHRNPKTGARQRICNSDSPAVACTLQRPNFAHENADLVWRSSFNMCSFCRARRISPVIRQVADFLRSRRPAGRCGSILGSINRRGVCTTC